MSRTRATPVLLAALLAAATPGHAAGTGLTPFEAVRSLQHLQDQIAEGDAIAQAAHAKAIERTARIFAAAKLSTWTDLRNSRALVLYLFSGGRGPMVANVIPASAVAAEYRKLYDGALAYSLGNDNGAREALMDIDPRSISTGVGGHLALVQATLCAEQDRAKAIALLDLARLLEPGTLIEEASLRKEMSLIGPTGNVDKYAQLARRYLSAFPHSVYADNFRQLVASTAMEIGRTDSDDAVLRLSRIAGSLDKADRCRLYLAIAKAAVLAGHMKMAAMAANQARDLTSKTGPESARATVYFGAATIVGDRFEEGRQALQSVKSEQLGTKDRALRASAVALADMIRRPPEAGEAKGLESTKIDVVADAERSLAEADQLLNRTSK